MSERTSRFVGCLLGTACGDVLGAAVEGHPAPGVIRDFLDTPRGFGRYTDDTQMTLALATSLVRCRGIDGRDCAAAYAAHYEADRGYGGGTHRVLRRLRAGADYRTTGRSEFAQGSFGNGGAMRIAPVGLLYGAGDLELLRRAVHEALRCTHEHPEAIDAAVVHACAVGRCLEAPRASLPAASTLLADLQAAAETDVMRGQLRTLSRLVAEDAGDGTAARTLGTGIRAVEAVPAALWAVLRHGTNAEEAIVRAVSLGGDTDTIGAMAGAVVGTLHGIEALPARWLDALENGECGRDHIERVGRELARVTVSGR